MKFFFKIFIFLLLFFTQNSLGISWFTNYKLDKAYKNKDYKKIRDILEKEQVETPNDAQLNYNLGAVYYKLGQIERAMDSFARCVKNCSSEQKKLKEFAHFNLGNCLYEGCLKLLPTGWEKMDTIEDQKINPAILQIQSAVENYKNVLSINEKNDKAKVNQKKAQELLEKLLKKRKQQENQQNQEKQKDQKDNKQQKDEQQSKQDDQKQDQQKQDKSQEDQSSKNNSEQQQDNQKNSAKKDNNKKEDKQQQQKGHDGAQDSANKADDGTKNEFDDKQDTQKDKGVSQKSTHDQDSQKNEQQTGRSEENGTKEEQEMQTQAAFGQEGQGDELKERGFRVILDDLQKDESKMQKMVIKQKSKGQEKRLNSNQKPW